MSIAKTYQPKVASQFGLETGLTKGADTVVGWFLVEASLVFVKVGAGVDFAVRGDLCRTASISLVRARRRASARRGQSSS